MTSAQYTLWGGESGADLHAETLSQGYALVPHHVPPEAIDAYAEAYGIFTDQLPDPEPEAMNAMVLDPKNLDRLDPRADKAAQWHKYRSNVPHPGKPNGYTNRTIQVDALSKVRGLDIADDPKEFFHYSPGMRDALEARHAEFGWGPMPPELLVLLMRAQTLHYAAKQAITGFYRALELTHPHLSDFTAPADLDHSPVRGVFYHKGQGDVLADGHYDRGLGTLQLAESHLGLRTRDPQTGEMIMVERDPRMGIAFPSLKWRQASPDSELQPLWHDVINVDTACEGRELHGGNIARWAIIFFTNSRDLADAKNIKSLTSSEVAA
ncbi:MAG TPA: hypothetical protein VK694_01700 [Verrucomicrobiae bacterium]|nr:hypothetical protein [Verrucomicrobiae bacterium]